MTRREFLSVVPAAFLVRGARPAPVTIPVRVIVDSRIRWRPESLQWFWYGLWPTAVRELAACGVRLQASPGTGEVGRPPGREPVVAGLDPLSLNIVVTDHIPMEWDSGRGLGGVTLRYRGCHLCMIALCRAHGNQVPLLSTNTLVHEVLHALLGDIFEEKAGLVSGQWREFRVDACATGLWLLHEGSGLRAAAQAYVTRLRAEAVPWTQ